MKKVKQLNNFYSFQLLSALLLASCFRLRFDIARNAFNAAIAICSKQVLTRIVI